MRKIDRLLRLVLASLALGAVAPVPAADGYDPLRVPVSVGASKSETLETLVADRKRARDIPVLVYLPAPGSPAPVVLFSHGLGGSRHGAAYLGRHWAARGYVAVFMQHAGSDSALWEGAGPVAGLRNLRRAANAENLVLRVGDVAAVLDRLEEWGRAPAHPLAGRLDLGRVGIAGHSFGAKTAQAVGGQSMEIANTSWTDRRIDAALLLSPSRSARLSPAESFGRVRIPWMLMTGTHDDAPIGNTTPASRLEVYPALPPGAKYELVLAGGEHHAFTDGPPRRGQGQRNPNHHRVVLALSTAFWDAYLRGDRSARAWLDGEGPRGSMEPGDRWQRK